MFKNFTASLTSLVLLVSGCTTVRYQHKTAAMTTEETQIACETYAQLETEVIHGDSVSGMVIGALIVGPLIGFVLPQWLMGLKPAAENDKKRSRIFEDALKKCLQPDTETADSIRVAGGRYYARKDYVEAELLYRRALDIEAKLPQAEFLAHILEDYGQLMWMTDRRVEAQQMIIRARSIRAKLDEQKRPK